MIEVAKVVIRWESNFTNTDRKSVILKVEYSAHNEGAYIMNRTDYFSIVAIFSPTSVQGGSQASSLRRLLKVR